MSPDDPASAPPSSTLTPERASAAAAEAPAGEVEVRPLSRAAGSMSPGEASRALVPIARATSLATQRRYLIKRPFWSFFERTFRVLSPDGQLYMLVKHPIFRLR